MGKCFVSRWQPGTTGTGTIDITNSAIASATIQAAIFFGGETRANFGSIDGDAVFCFGAVTSGSAEGWVGVSSEDGQGSTDVRRHVRTDSCFGVPFGGGGINGLISFNSWITNGIRVDIDDNFNQTNWDYWVVFITGDDVSVDLGTALPNTSNGGTWSKTGIGFRPDLILFWSGGMPGPDIGTPGNTSGDYATFSFGAVVDDGSLTQRAIGFAEDDAVGSGDPGGRISTDRVGGQIGVGGGTWLWSAELTSFDASGFTLTTRDGSTGGDELMYLAIEGGFLYGLNTISMPTSTGSFSLPDPGFIPDFRLFGMIAADTLDAAEGANAGAWGIGILEDNGSTIEAGSHAVHVEAGAGTTNTGNVSSDDGETAAIFLPTDAGGTLFKANKTDMETLDFDNVAGSTRYWFDLALKDIGDAVGQRHEKRAKFLNHNASQLGVEGVTI